MKVGDEIICQYCGASSFLVKKTIMDGWTKKGEVLLCSSCSKVIQNMAEDEKLKEKDKSEVNRSESLNKLTGFLGVEEILKPKIASEDSEKQFCRDCKHYISHPFLDRCSLHQIEVNPMDDCKSFKSKK